MQICPNCGEENPPRFRLCGFCGAALVEAAAPIAPREIRKTVTIVFCDLVGSTSLGERLDSESLREVMNRYFAAMRAELEDHGGTIEKFIGDAIMAVFGLPTLHEDDALRAVRAAAGMQTALLRLNDELDRSWGIRLANRTGVHTGEVVAGDPTGGQRLVTGDPVNTAARLEQAAPTNEILIGELTYRLVREAVEVEQVAPLELKGKLERVPAYRLVAVSDEAVRGRDIAAPEASPMVGRAGEIARLREAFAAAVEKRSLRIVTIVGDAGVGKSRLTREFLASVAEEAYVVRGRCLPYGRGITFWPLVEIVRSAAEIDDDDPPERARAKLRGLVGDEDVAERLASVTGLGDLGVSARRDVLGRSAPGRDALRSRSARRRDRRHPLRRADPARSHRASVRGRAGRAGADPLRGATRPARGARWPGARARARSGSSSLRWAATRPRRWSTACSGSPG